MSKAHDAQVTGQFGPRAQAYVESQVHAKGEDLEALEGFVRAARPSRALDIGTGGGHVAYVLARHAQRVTACDLSADMLAAVTATASAKSLANVETILAAAERLPFDNAQFDFVASRYSAHHWRDFEAGLREARRVAQPGAHAIFMDAFAPADPLFDTHIQAIELLRDTSHVRDYALGEWMGALARAGFAVRSSRRWRLRLEFASWSARMRTPALYCDAVRALQRAAPAETQAYFAIEPDGSFMLDTMLIEAVAG